MSRRVSKKKIERDFQAGLIKKLKSMFEGCIVTKLDSSYIQGIPDLLILFKNMWATLEVKKSENSPKRPNQDYYVDQMNKMSFSRFIYPENEEEVLNDLQNYFDTNHNDTYIFAGVDLAEGKDINVETIIDQVKQNTSRR